VGRQNAPAAISITGFITGLPIFCDSGFIVLSGLNRSLSAKSMVSPVFMSTVLACSLYSVHCLIPPHPGATAAAGILGANLGELILLGIAVAIPASFAGFGWARLLTRRGYQSRMINHPEETPEATPLPPAGRSFLPVLVPLLLISGKALAGLLFPGNNSPWMQFVGFAGDPVIALMTGMILAFTLIPGFNLKTLNHILFTTIEKAGPILIITAAGGIFGAVIKASGTGELAGSFLSATGLGLLIPFLLTFILKTAQGSSTVAIITAASIIGPMLEQLGMSGESDRLLAMLAMGAGSMAVSHANDSYFWVITNFSGIDANDTLKVYSSATIIMGLTAFASVVVLSFFMA
jgi:GntP family gluconate:H+ symporter